VYHLPTLPQALQASHSWFHCSSPSLSSSLLQAFTLARVNQVKETKLCQNSA
jgi:hypothetical protein